MFHTQCCQDKEYIILIFQNVTVHLNIKFKKLIKIIQIFKKIFLI